MPAEAGEGGALVDLHLAGHQAGAPPAAPHVVGAVAPVLAAAPLGAPVVTLVGAPAVAPLAVLVPDVGPVADPTAVVPRARGTDRHVRYAQVAVRVRSWTCVVSLKNVWVNTRRRLVRSFLRPIRLHACTQMLMDQLPKEV